MELLLGSPDTAPSLTGMLGILHRCMSLAADREPTYMTEEKTLSYYEAALVEPAT
jgi:hypothetical protein